MNIKDVILNVDLINLVKSDVLVSIKETNKLVIDGISNLIENKDKINEYKIEIDKRRKEIKQLIREETEKGGEKDNHIITAYIKNIKDMRNTINEIIYSSQTHIFSIHNYYLSDINNFIHDIIIKNGTNKYPYTNKSWYTNKYGLSFDEVRKMVSNTTEIEDIRYRYNRVVNECIDDVSSLIYEFYFSNLIYFIIYRLNGGYSLSTNYIKEKNISRSEIDKYGNYIYGYITDESEDNLYYEDFIKYLSDTLNVYEKDKNIASLINYTTLSNFTEQINDFLKNIPYYPLVDYALSEDLYFQLLSFNINYNQKYIINDITKKSEYRRIVNGKMVKTEYPDSYKIYNKIIYIVLLSYTIPILYFIKNPEKFSEA